MCEGEEGDSGDRWNFTRAPGSRLFSLLSSALSKTQQKEQINRKRPVTVSRLSLRQVQVPAPWHVYGCMCGVHVMQAPPAITHSLSRQLRESLKAHRHK